MVFVCSAYDQRFTVAGFDCGQPTLTAWLTYGFLRSPAEPSLRMVRKISDIHTDVDPGPRGERA